MPIQPQPETTFNQLWDHLTDLEKGSMTEFELRRFERDVDNVLRVDRAGGLELKAYLAAYRGDADAALRLHDQSLIGSDSVLRSSIRCMLALYKWEYPQQLLDLFWRRRELIRNDLAAIRTVVNLLVSIGQREAAEALAAEAPRLGGIVEVTGVSDEADSIDFERIPAELQERSSELEGAFAFVRQFAASHGVKIVHVDASLIPSERGDDVVLCKFLINKPIDEVADLEWEMFSDLDESRLPEIRGGGLVLALSSAV